MLYRTLNVCQGDIDLDNLNAVEIIAYLEHIHASMLRDACMRAMAPGVAALIRDMQALRRLAMTVADEAEVAKQSGSMHPH